MEYHDNSKKAREAKTSPPEEQPEKDVKRIVDSEVRVKNKSIGQKMKRIFFGGEFRNAAQYIVGDVLLPAARNAVVDATTKGIERMVWGEDQRRPSGTNRAGNVQYNRPGSVLMPDQPPRYYGSTRAMRESKNVIFGTREEAIGVLDQMNEICSQYRQVSVADMNHMCGLPIAAVDQKWGWTNLVGSNVRQTRDGFVMELPPMEEI